MKLPAPPTFKAQDFPDLPTRLLELLTMAFRTVFDAFANVPESAEATDKFVTSSATGTARLELKNELPGPPRHLNVTLLRNDDAPDTATAWGHTWRSVNGVIRVSFVGLTASTKYRINVEYR